MRLEVDSSQGLSHEQKNRHDMLERKPSPDDKYQFGTSCGRILSELTKANHTAFFPVTLEYRGCHTPQLLILLGGRLA